MDMNDTAGSQTFSTDRSAYDLYMGRYSAPLAEQFAAFSGVRAGDRALDVGCGPGALTSELVRTCGADNVFACDPSPRFVEDCASANRGAQVRSGRAEQLPYDDDVFDQVYSQLVLHFVSDGPLAAAEMVRVAKPGATISMCVWDVAQGPQMLRALSQAAAKLDPDAPQALRVLRFGAPGDLAALLAGAGCEQIHEEVLMVSSAYTDFAELWSGFLTGIGPAGSYAVGLPALEQAALRAELFKQIGSPTGEFTLTAGARAARASAPRRG